ncbi:hypothetical protein [Caulobacter segnis]|uniref:Uncharacterized protein n=1 Tax=Caulobacter segnis TaxID=88688 RepID=A0A2W5X2F6_9CAUL|nr:hypothetical protein [Caulobacter segnis]PZR30741.1 MAG: hypothetical protein DI526_21665 [Caulobacter segnis]
MLLAIALHGRLYGAMQKLSFFWFLLEQASLHGAGALSAATTLLVFLLPERRKASRLCLLPALWLFPLPLGAIFYEGGMKTAGWIGYVSVLILVAYIVVTGWSVFTLEGRRGFAIVCALLNAPFILLSSLVLGLASGGTWL